MSEPQGGAKRPGGVCCGMCEVPNTPNLGAKPSALHWALQGPMMPCHALVAKWVGDLHVLGLSLPRVGHLHCLHDWARRYVEKIAATQQS